MAFEQEAARLVVRIGAIGAESVQRELSGIGASISDVGRSLVGGALSAGVGAAVAGIGALAGGLALSVREAMGAEEIQAQLAAVLKSTGGAAGVTAENATELADALAGVTKFGDEAILGGENILLTFTNIGKDVFPQATETMLDMSQALGQDLKSSAIQLGKALQDPIQGVSALSRVGVNFTDAQKEQIETLVKSGRVMDAQKLILKELQTEFGGSAKAAGQTFGGQLAILQNQVGNVLEDIGKQFLPVLKELTAWVNKDIVPAFKDWAARAMPVIMTALRELGAWVQTVALPALREFGAMIVRDVLPQLAQLGAWVQTVALPALQEFGAMIVRDVLPRLAQFGAWVQKNVLPILKDIGDWIIKNVLPPLGQLAQWLGNNVVPALEKLGTFIDTVALPALRALGDWLSGDGKTKFDEFTNTIKTALQPIFDELAKFWTEIQPKLEKAWTMMQAVAADVWDAINLVITTVVGNLQAFMDEHGAQIAAILQGVWDAISGAVQVVWSLISGIVKIALDLLGGDFEQAGADWKEMMDGVWEGIKGIIGGAWAIITNIIGIALQELWKAIDGKLREIRTNIEQIWEGVVTFFTGLPQTLFTMGQNIIQGLIDGFWDQADAIRRALDDIVQSAINANKSRLGIRSPSQVFAEMGENMARGLMEGFATPQLNFAPAIAGAGLAGARASGASAMVERGDTNTEFHFHIDRADFSTPQAAETEARNFSFLMQARQQGKLV